MGVNRIVRRALVRSGGARRMMHKYNMTSFFRFGERKAKRATVWLDLRPRDKHGILAGHCSEVEAERRANAESAAKG